MKEVEYIGPIQNAAPTVWPLTAAQLRDHMRVASTDEDATILEHIQAATGLVEGYLGKSLLSQTWKLYLNYGFPKTPRGEDAPIVLAKSPIISIQKVYYAQYSDGAETELATYQTQLAGSNPLILPAYQESWPQVREVLEAVRVEYTAGYGVAATALPPQVIQAVRMIATSFYKNRELFSPEMKLQNLESYPVLRLLLDPIRTRRFGSA